MQVCVLLLYVDMVRILSRFGCAWLYYGIVLLTTSLLQNDAHCGKYLHLLIILAFHSLNDRLLHTDSYSTSNTPDILPFKNHCCSPHNNNQVLKDANHKHEWDRLTRVVCIRYTCISCIITNIPTGIIENDTNKTCEELSLTNQDYLKILWTSAAELPGKQASLVYCWVHDSSLVCALPD